jgi:rhamnulokinase
VRRFAHRTGESDGHLRWNFPTILDEIKAGLREAGARARADGRRIHSIGVDSWGVDYGLVNAQGNLIENPICYRDHRTRGVMEQVFARVPREEIFERTGIQFLNFNTLFQLYAHAQTGIPEQAIRLMMIPDLVNLFLTGKAATEFTNATTTQMLSAHSGTWDCELLDRLGISSKLLGNLVYAGTELGPLKSELANELGLEGARVVAPATHDTGSAVAGTPLEPGWAYVSSGTWSLVGIELDKVDGLDGPLINAEVRRHNFTNEGGVFGTTRFLKNVMGLWILESCRREWKDRGLDIDYETLLAEAAQIDNSDLIFPDDERFFNQACWTR